MTGHKLNYVHFTFVRSQILKKKKKKQWKILDISVPKLRISAGQTVLFLIDRSIVFSTVVLVPFGPTVFKFMSKNLAGKKTSSINSENFQDMDDVLWRHIVTCPWI